MNEIPHQKTDHLFNPKTERADRINEDLTLISLKDGLLFGTDSFFLAAFTKSSPSGSAAELGAGCGVVSLLCAQKGKFSSIKSIELRETTASICKRNAELNCLSDRIEVIRADVREILPEKTGGQVDVVFSNPPYMKPGTGKENESDELNAARRELNGDISDFCRSASRILKYGGTFSVVWRPERICDLFCAMRDAKIEPKRIVYILPFSDAPPSLVLVEGKSGASTGLIYSRPLIIYEKRGGDKYTADAAEIYDTFSVEHLFR